MRPLRLVIKVLAYNRPNVLRQCLLNLQAAYFLETANLDIFIDGPKDETDRDLVFKSVEVANNFEWRHGEKRVVARSANVGILGQWLGCWEDPRDGEYALVVEDDVELTPLFPLILRQLIPHLKPGLHYGLSLQQPQWQLGQNEKGGWRRLDLIRPDHPRIFSYPAIGTWGQLLVADAWRDFLSSPISNAIDGLIMSKWHSERANLFTPAFMHWQAGSGYTNLYTNLGVNGTAFAISSQPVGVNFKEVIYHDRLADERQVFDWLAETIHSKNIPRFNECFDLMSQRGEYDLSQMTEEEVFTFICGLKATRSAQSFVIRSEYPSLVHRLGFIPDTLSHEASLEGVVVCPVLRCPWRCELYPDPKYTI